MQHRPVRHREAEVDRPAAAAVLPELHRGDAPLGIVAHGIVDAEIMPLAGDGHVVVAVIAHLGGLAGARRHHGAGDGQVVALAFLAAEAAAHAPRLDPHAMHRQAQGMGDLVLDLARMLSGAVHHHVAAFLRQRQRGLALEVEMLLSAHFQPAGQGQRRGLQPGLDIAEAVDARTFLEAGICGERLVDGEDRRFRGDLGPAERCRPPRSAMAGGGDEKQRLAHVMHRPVAEERLVMKRRGRAIGEGIEIGGGQHGHHARGGPHGVEIERDQPAARDLREAEGEVQAILRHGNVVEIAGGAGDMQLGRVMGEGLGDAHARTSRTERVAP